MIIYTLDYAREKGSLRTESQKVKKLHNVMGANKQMLNKNELELAQK